MIEKNVTPPIAEPASSAPSSSPHCGSIVETGMEDRSEAVGSAGLDDEEQWIATVLKALEARSHGVKEALKQALSHGDQTAPVGCASAGASPIQLPLPEADSSDNRHSDQESDPSQWQSLATRSNISQHPENPQKSAIEQADSRLCDTQVGHNGAFSDRITLSNRSGNRSQQWVTRLGHNRSVHGLSLRGSIYQFRVRVPVDLPRHNAMSGFGPLRVSLGNGMQRQWVEPLSSPLSFR